VTPVIIARYYWFGTSVRYLQDAAETSIIQGDSYILTNLNEFFKRLDELNLQVTKRASKELREFREGLKTALEEAVLGPEAATLRKLMKDIRKTLEAELRGMEAYVVSPKRIDTEKLLKNVPSLFAPNVYDKFSDLVKLDFTEAGKCIAFERSTAAAFHILRGTEGLLRDFYCAFVKRNRCKPLLWHCMVQGLLKNTKAKKHVVLIRNLDNIRLSFRNPTQHPEKIYDIHEVQDLWGLAVDVSNRMVLAMRDMPSVEEEILFPEPF